MSKTAGIVAVGCFIVAFKIASIDDHPKPNVTIHPPLAPVTPTPTVQYDPPGGYCQPISPGGPPFEGGCGTDSDLTPDTYAPGYTPPPALPPIPHMGGEVGKIPLGERLV